MRFHKSLMGALAFLALSSAAVAQEQQQPRTPRGDAIEKIQIESIVAGDGDVLTTVGGPNTFIFVNSELSFERKTVKGAPYSAEATTETIQTLSDGNRIIRKNTATIYRDSEGRTRREQTLGAIGAWTAAGDPAKSIFINDPVLKVNYTLDPKTQTARKMSITELSTRTFTRVAAPPAPGAQGPAPDRLRVVEPNASGERLQRQQPKVESLGKQVIEGVEAEGTRTTITIPAGKIGNEREINIVTERWYSPELQVVVYSKKSDPIAGETTYRLTNISRDEPAHSLFEVPPGYKIKEGPTFFNGDFNFKYQEERKSQPQ